MKHRTKLSVLLLCLVLLVSVAFTFTACGGGGDTHEHEWGEWETVTAATCSAKGLEKRVCTLDATHVEERDIAQLEHTWDAGVVTTEPTETEAGVKTFTCSGCNTTKTEAIAALGHTHAPALVAAKDATCTEAGNTAYYACSCGKYFADEAAATEIALSATVVNAKGHTPGAEATCASAQTCTVCNAELAPALAHTPGAAATCTTAQTCTVCSAELAKAKGHTPGAAATCTTAQICTVCEVTLADAKGHTPGAAATCTTAQTCTVCNAELAAAKGHKPGEEASCTTAQTCTRCDEVIVAALGHKYEDYVCTVCGTHDPSDPSHVHSVEAFAASEATCAEAGNEAFWYCYDCDTMFSDEAATIVIVWADVVIAPLPHTPGDAATCTTRQACTVCGETIVDALGHTAGAAATCTTAQTCTVCGDVVAPAKGHTAGDAATCTAAQTCKVCGEVIAEAKGHTLSKAATCTEDQICIVCEIVFEEAKGHTAGAAATCTTAQTCTVCSAELAAALGHKYENGACKVCSAPDPSAPTHTHKGAEVAAKAPTCTEAGNIAYYVCECGKYFSDAAATAEISLADTVVKATGHDYADGACTVCGAAEDLFYLNMLESWKNYDGFAIDFSGMEAVVKNRNYYGDEWETVEVKMPTAELMLYVDENGELQGAVNVEMSIFNGPVENGLASIDVKGVIENGELFFCADMKEGSDAVESFTANIQVTELIEFALENMEADTSSSMLTSLINIGSEYVLPLIKHFRNANAQEINDAVKFAVELLCTATETVDGFVYTLDFDKVKAINADLATLTISELVDKYFGEGSYAAIGEAVTAVLGTKLSELPAALDSLGISSEILVNAINEVVRASHENNANFDILAIINSDDLKDLTVEQFIVIMMSDMGGGTAPNPEDPGYEGGEDFVDEGTKVELTTATDGEGETDEMPSITDTILGYLEQFKDVNVYDMITAGDADAKAQLKTQIDGAIDMVASVISVSFSTDKKGFIKDSEISANLPEIQMSEDVKESFKFTAKITMDGRIDTDFKAALIEKVTALHAPAAELDVTAKYVDPWYNTDASITVGDKTVTPQRFYFYMYDLSNVLGTSAYPECRDGIDYEFIVPYSRYRADVWVEHVSREDGQNYVNRYYSNAKLTGDYITLTVTSDGATFDLPNADDIVIVYEDIFAADEGKDEDDLKYYFDDLFDIVVYLYGDKIPMDWFVCESTTVSSYSFSYDKVEKEFYDNYHQFHDYQPNLSMSSACRTYFVCTKCGDYYYSENHKYELNEEESEIVCEQESKFVHECTVCGDKQIDYWTRSHWYVTNWEESTWAESCLENSVVVSDCEYCGDRKVETRQGNHNYQLNEEESNISDSCLITGIRVYYCEYCNDRMEQPTNGAHNPVVDENRSIIAENCGDYYETHYVCSACGYYIEWMTREGYLEHEFDEGVEYSFSEGSVLYSSNCVRCGAVTEALFTVPEGFVFNEVNGSGFYFTFTPEKDGTYIFYSERDTDVYADPLIEIYDATGNYVGDDDDDGGDMNFYCEINLKAGESYEICIYTRGYFVPFDVFVKAK